MAVEIEGALSRLKEQLLGRVPKDPEGIGCFLCKWILEDLHQHKRLTDTHPPKSIDGSIPFPASGKARHLILEGFWSKELESIFGLTSKK
jgi:hypothetical protein